MMSRCPGRFIAVLLLFCVVAVALVHAVYDPREITTKPPKRREKVLPWYTSDKVDSDEDLSRSSKWQTEPDEPIPKKPYVVDAGTKTWSPWRKKKGSEIEQRTEVADQSTTNLEQQTDYSLEQSQLEQQSNQHFPPRPDDSGELVQNTKDKGQIHDDQEFYEGISPDSTKPRKEKLLVPTKPKSTVAVYDAKLGVQCPEFDSTGEFVYPPDCKFYVSCWKGRAFVQPCAPGTLFNPDTLECDFPHKVKCYGGEVADFPSNENLDSSEKREPLLSGSHHANQKLQEPQCPPYLTGLLPHPSDCTKYLQCAHGGLFIRDCGPGTVFNPAISVCDWPRNVKGCEDALKSDEESTTPLVPPYYDYEEHVKLQNTKHEPAKTISCPPDYTGLLPHPDTCKKFLQCTNGGTFVMDCGPGTAFNPLISVCDWPYNVPACNNEKEKQASASHTTIKPWWSSQSSTTSKPWPHNHRQPDYQYTYPNKPLTTTSPPPTDWDSLRPTWRPSWPQSTTTRSPPQTDWHTMRPPVWDRRPGSWTTATPPNTQTGVHTSYPDTGRDYGTVNQQQEHRQHGQWGQTQDSAYPQWPHNHRADEQSPNYDDGHHGHHHHHHQHRGHNPHGHAYDSNRGMETQQPTPSHGQSFPQRPGQDIPDAGRWNYNTEHHHDHRHPHHDGLDRQHPMPDSGWNFGESDDDTQQQSRPDLFSETPVYPSNHNDESNTQGNRRIGAEVPPNRQDHGRTGPGVWRPVLGTVPMQSGNVGNGHQRPVQGDWRIDIENKTSWTQPVPAGHRPMPGSWNQFGSEAPTQNQHWDHGTVNEDDKFHEWGTRTNVYQSTSDKEADAKLNQWMSKTNIFLSGKGQPQPGVKDRSPNTLNHSYPNNVFFNANLTREHFFPREELDGNDSHSKTNLNRPNDIKGSNKFGRNDQHIYTESEMTNYNLAPPLHLQGPFYKPINRTIEANILSQNSNISANGYGHLVPRRFGPTKPGAIGSGLIIVLNGSGTNYHRVPVPSTVLQPPYPPINRSLPFPFAAHTGDVFFPPLPPTNLQPPSTNSSFAIGWQYPSVPITTYQPVYFQPLPHREILNHTPSHVDGRSKPSTSFQPPNQLPPPGFTPNVTVPYPHAPATNLEPPIPETNVSNSDLPNQNATLERVPLLHETVPPKKKNVSQSKESPQNRRIMPQDTILPAVWIEHENSTSTEAPKFEKPDVEPDVEPVMEADVEPVIESEAEPDVDVMVDKEVWKPVLVFENRTQTTTQPSVIMKIDKKKVDLDLFNIEAAPYEQEEPPFPTYYVPPVAPLNHSRKVALTTPISGQVVRLRGGSGPHEGYVEVQGTNPGWGIVCDSRNSWTLKEAHVVCRQLGYVKGAEMAWQGRNNQNGVPTWIAANTVTCQGDEAKFQSCKFTHEQECRVERDAIGVSCVSNRVAHCRKDEIPYEGQCYHLADPESGLNHAEALDYCSSRQARLVDITSQAENDFVSEWIVQKHPEVASIMTSGVGFTTLNRTLWLWEDSSQAKFRFTKWWPGWLQDKNHSPFVGARPLCVVMKRKFPCHERPDSICVADYFFWDTEDCAASMKGHSYICKRPYDDIGCIYGKGSQYVGNANVTASGKECLPWADQRVAYPLTVNVVNRDVREKLKAHNYCRNPNPTRESRPWCFTGAGAQKEYCDIPPCGNVGSPRSRLVSQCKPKHFECMPGECIPSPWVCDGDEDCTNGADERDCVSHMNLFQKYSKHKLEGYDVQKWLNTPLKTCALRCKEADFTCRSFVHKAVGNICLLSDSNIGLTGSLKPDKEYDYYEMKERSVNCEGMFVCNNRKCINQTEVCNGKNDCNDRSDENICTVENLGYDIRLAGADEKHEGRIEVKILGVWGQVCDDGFGMIDADVICKELGFTLGALEVRPGGFYGNMDPPTRFMVDQLRCRGNETTLRECDFDGWGVHNCQPEEAVGVVCKTAVDTCQDGYWKCDNSPMCIPTAFICDQVTDCRDASDESSDHCDAPFEIRLANGSSPLEGRVEVRHHGIWGTVCDDDFSNATATVICRSLGYGGRAIAKKDGYFGPGEGPIWLDEVFCFGNETQLYRCEHNHWGQHNCNHDEDAGVICTPGDVNDSKLHWESVPPLPETDINDILPANCGRRFKDFNEDEDMIFEKVVRGTLAPKGAYPWQASIRVRAHSGSSHWCGAVMLSPLHVLTAAHCLQGYNKGTYFVRAGDYNTEIDEGTEAEANIEDYYIHEDFRKGHRMNNDIALVLLKGRGIPLGKDVMPICLPPEKTEYPPGLNCTISGFGSIETGKSTHSKDLRYGWIPLLDQSVCRAGHVYGDGAISDGMVCAGYLDEGIDTCDGDSGGPLACLHNGAFTLYGITSWGQHCGRANKPGVYVRVSHYRRWIDQKIKDSLAGR